MTERAYSISHHMRFTAVLCIVLSVAIAGSHDVQANPLQQKAAAVDEALRRNALNSLIQSPTGFMPRMLSFMLDPGGPFGDIAVAATLRQELPQLASHVEVDLTVRLRTDPATSAAVREWVTKNAPQVAESFGKPLEITPELFHALAEQTPEKLDELLSWLAESYPDMIEKSIRSIAGRANKLVLDAVVHLARKYPQMAARAVGFVARNYPDLLPTLMRLLIMRGPAVN